MIGPLEILIVVLIVALLIGYKRLPALGRSAGQALRSGGEKSKELAATAGKKAESVDTDKIIRSAGDGLREARELRDSVKGIGSTEPAGEKASKASGSAGGDRGGESGPNGGETA